MKHRISNPTTHSKRQQQKHHAHPNEILNTHISGIIRNGNHYNKCDHSSSACILETIGFFLVVFTMTTVITMKSLMHHASTTVQEHHAIFVKSHNHSMVFQNKKPHQQRPPKIYDNFKLTHEQCEILGNRVGKTVSSEADRQIIAETCREIQNQSTSGHSNHTTNNAADNIHQWLIFNDFHQERWWCGTLLLPHELRLLKKDGTAVNNASTTTTTNTCLDYKFISTGSTRLFETDPDKILQTQYSLESQTSAEQQRQPSFPVIQLDVESEDKNLRPNWECNVPCFVGRRKLGLKTNRQIGGTDWSFLFSMEASHYYHDVKIDPQNYKQNHYYSTTSFKSEVPVPYFSWPEYAIQGSNYSIVANDKSKIKTSWAVDYHKGIKGASFLARNCNSKNGREDLVKDLIQSGFRVDALSKCLKNAELPPNVKSLKNKMEVQRQYLFHLSFENGAENDYITEKLWGTLESGTLPVYHGAPNVKEHVPENSIIVSDDFPSHDALAKYLIHVSNNQTLYESYHAWRYKELPDKFKRMYNFTYTHSNCRMCRWAYAKKYGLGWDHEQQQMRDLIIPKGLKLDRKTGSIQKPFREQWMKNRRGHTMESVKATTTTPTSMMQSADCTDFVCSQKYQTVELQNDGIRRTVWSHDGVIDIHILENVEGLTKNFTMQLQTDVQTTALVQHKHRNKNIFQLQDHQTRFTLLTNWDANITSSAIGTLDVSLDNPSLTSRRFQKLAMRVIIEDVDTLHLDGEKATYHFGETMTKDFFNPVQLLYIGQ